MLHIWNICGYLKIITDDELKDFVVINFGECFKSKREKIYSKLCEKQHLEKIPESLYIFLTRPYKVEKYSEMMQPSTSYNCLCHCNTKILNLFEPELQLIINKPIIKNKLKSLLSELKKIKAQPILVLEYKWSFNLLCGC